MTQLQRPKHRERGGDRIRKMLEENDKWRYKSVTLPIHLLLCWCADAVFWVCKSPQIHLLDSLPACERYLLWSKCLLYAWGQCLGGQAAGPRHYGGAGMPRKGETDPKGNKNLKPLPAVKWKDKGHQWQKEFTNFWPWQMDPHLTVHWGASDGKFTYSWCKNLCGVEMSHPALHIRDVLISVWIIFWGNKHQNIPICHFPI